MVINLSPPLGENEPKKSRQARSRWPDTHMKADIWRSILCLAAPLKAGYVMYDPSQDVCKPFAGFNIKWLTGIESQTTWGQ